MYFICIKSLLFLAIAILVTKRMSSIWQDHYLLLISNENKLLISLQKDDNNVSKKKKYRIECTAEMGF